jgi:hypothetical protein
MTEIRKRLVLSVITLPISGVLGWVLQHTLSYWGILDPIAQFLGNWLKVNIGTSIDLPGMLWGIALFLSLLLYAAALFLIWKRNRPHTSASPAVLGISKSMPSRGAALPSSQAPASPPSNMAIKRDNAHPVATSATAERKRPAPTSMIRPEPPIATEPKATGSYPCLAELDPHILYDIDHEKGTVLLKYLPDVGNIPQKAQKAIELILFGNELLLELDRTPIDVADYAIQKSNVRLPLIYDVHPGALRADSPAERAAGDGMGNRIIREGLATGGSLRLHSALYESTAGVAADLIRRGR